MNNKCLIIVDLQNDFCEGGVYPVYDSLSIILNIGDILKNFKNIIFTKRCYDPNDIIFKKGISKHCIDGTHGSEINFGLIKCNDYAQIKRPFDKSIFSDGTSKNYKINHILKEKKITDIYFCGLDFITIFNSILDAYKYGYNCYLLNDCITKTNDDSRDRFMLFLNHLGVNIIEASNT